MINMRFKTHIAKATLALTLAAVIPAASLPATAHAHPGQTDSSVEGRTIEESPVDGSPVDGSPVGDSPEISTRQLLSAGPYEEGRVLVLRDNTGGSTDEELVGASASSALATATVVDTVSGESYTKATGKALDSVNGEDLVGSSQEDGSTDSYDEDRISILLVEDIEKSTQELLEEVLSDPTVLYAQPDYLHGIDGSDMDDAGSEEVFLEEDRTLVEDPEQEKNAQGEGYAEEEQNSSRSHTEEDLAQVESYNLSEELKTQDSSDPIVGAATIPDLTGWQWEHAGSSLIPKTEAGPEAVYNVHAPSWNQTGTTNSEGIVAVLDTGVDYTHPDLRGVMYEFSPELQETLSCGPYGINVSGDGDSHDPMDYHGHGTHCSGVIAGEWNGTGISGSASGCQIIGIRLANDKTQISDLSVVNGMAFVAKAVDSGVDIRVTSNSYSGEITNALIATELAELEERGVVSVYSSGNKSENNDFANTTSNMVRRASNTVVVDAATALRNKGEFSNYSEGMTDLFAPGASILSTITTQSKANSSKSYAASLDSAAYYYNTTFEEVPNVLMTADSNVELSCDKSEGSYSFDADGKMLKVTLDKADEVSAFSFELEIPVGSQSDVPYVSLATYIPDGQSSVKIYRIGTGKDGTEVRAKSSDVTVNGNWAFLSCTGVPDYTAAGASFPVSTHDGDAQNYIKIGVDVYKPDGEFKAGDIVCIDRIGAGANANALLPYANWDGTSMACPEVSAEAIILYKGLKRSKASAVEVVRKIKSKVISGETLENCTSHGAMDMAVTEDQYVPVVENAVCDKAKKTITITGCNFRSSGKVFLSETETEIVSWSGEQIEVRCPGTMNSGVQVIRVENAVGSGSGSFLLYAPDTSQDKATPLYETDIPDIPEDLFPEGGLVQATVGLNDRIYVFIADSFTHKYNYGNKVLCYSVKNRNWESITDMPVSLCDISVTGYRGKLLVTGSQTIGEDSSQKILEYSPTTKEWTTLDLNVPAGTAIINVNGTVYSVGGHEYNKEEGTDRAMTEIYTLDIPTGKTVKAGDLQVGIRKGCVASDGQAIYVAGGYTGTKTSSEASTERLQKITLEEDGTVTTEEMESPFKYAAQTPYFINEVITGYQTVYLTGYVGAAVFEEEPDLSAVEGVRTYTDSNGMTILDADTFVLTDDQFLPYGKRIAHDALYMVHSTEYKGELYAFGSSIYEEDKYLDLVSRQTKVGSSNAPVWDTFTVKIPEVKDLVYDGTQLTGVSESAEGYYTVTGNVGTDPGTYTAVLTLTDPDRCIWEDGTTEDKSLVWNITDGPTAGPTVTVLPTVTDVPTVTAAPTVTAVPTVTKAVTSVPTVTAVPTVTVKATAQNAAGSKSATNSASAAKATATVKTGDTSRPLLWICVAAVAIVLILIVLKRRKK